MPEKDDLPSIDDLGDRINSARPLTLEEKLKQHTTENQGTALGRGMRVASELLAALIVAGVMGFGIDRLLNTTPWFLLIGIGFGFAAGVLNVQRAFGEINESLERADKEE